MNYRISKPTVPFSQNQIFHKMEFHKNKEKKNICNNKSEVVKNHRKKNKLRKYFLKINKWYLYLLQTQCLQKAL